MLHLRARLATLLAKTGMDRLYLSATAQLPTAWQHLIVVCWHRVAKDLGPGFDHGVVDAMPEQFDRQVALLKQYRTIVSIADIVNHRETGRPLPPNPALLTFDDGYRDCVTTALPILKKHDAKAVFFIPTAYMGTGRLFAWERIGAVLARCRKPTIDITYPEPLRLSLSDDATRRKAARRLVHLSRTRVGIDWARFHDGLAAACDVPWDAAIERKLADELILDWPGVRGLRDAGMDVESHGHSHALFPYITAEEVEQEAVTSRQILETEMGRAPVALGYPAGAGLAAGHAGHAAMVKAGYKLGFLLDSTASRLGAVTDWLNLSRLASEPGVTEEHFRSALAFPKLMG